MLRTAKCLCGEVRLTLELANNEAGACHCGMCRRWAGGPLIAVGAQSVIYDAKDTLTKYKSSEWAEREFCCKCGSGILYRVTMEGTFHGMTHVPFGILDDISGLELTSEVFIDNRPDLYKFEGNIPGKTEAELMAVFQSTMKKQTPSS